MSQAVFNSKEPTSAGGAQPVPRLLHLLATVEEGCWISYFSCCCDKVSDKVQLKKEKVCFGS